MINKFFILLAVGFSMSACVAGSNSEETFVSQPSDKFQSCADLENEIANLGASASATRRKNRSVAGVRTGGKLAQVGTLLASGLGSMTPQTALVSAGALQALDVVAEHHLQSDFESLESLVARRERLVAFHDQRCGG